MTRLIYNKLNSHETLLILLRLVCDFHPFAEEKMQLIGALWRSFCSQCIQDIGNSLNDVSASIVNVNLLHPLEDAFDTWLSMEHQTDNLTRLADLRLFWALV